ncbi:predicted protein [Chaetomium globosum CBS 148.51]|uniref:Uncharacterized protein n=1 Tax=Chaetomium globosum (strain ATCC 6205 / CBS 148.51 / DSM 1962 / NBRC 6347 / NRRL 1970) TaxID=306901 RepID=Q2H895_CHAGB|nr:uncharacterized protein CHGG_03559 [Chaetomium globosum CBS 148.51]EAQ91624.1 predicted protein [Chaetomium globosum CBS 148.51]
MPPPIPNCPLPPSTAPLTPHLDPTWSPTNQTPNTTAPNSQNHPTPAHNQYPTTPLLPLHPHPHPTRKRLPHPLPIRNHLLPPLAALIKNLKDPPRPVSAGRAPLQPPREHLPPAALHGQAEFFPRRWAQAAEGGFDGAEDDVFDGETPYAWESCWELGGEAVEVVGGRGEVWKGAGVRGMDVTLPESLHSFIPEDVGVGEGPEQLGGSDGGEVGWWHKTGEVEKQREAGEVECVGAIQDIGSFAVPSGTCQRSRESLRR